MLDVLIAAAHPSELKGLRDALGRSLSGRVRGLRVAASTIGVGVPAAAIGTIRALREHEPRALVLLGSCGVYGRAPLLTAAVPETMQLVDAAVIAGRAAFPEPMPVRAKVHRALSAGIVRSAGKGVLRGSLATTAGITTSDGLARRIAQGSGCLVENLEGVAVGLACESERVPFAGLLVVTNVVGKRGREQWFENHGAAAQRGAAIVLEWIERGAPGVPRG
jgi:nucleoside phosphorylase